MSTARPPNRRGRGERGVAVVEFALVAPLLFILIFAIIDLGRAYSTLNQLAASAREGARLAAVLANPLSSTAQKQVRDAVKQFSLRQLGGPQVHDDQIAITRDMTTGTVTVAVRDYPFQLMTPFVGVVGLRRTIPITRQATFRWERAAIE
jgi:Flp pilus assembly protein TadG